MKHSNHPAHLFASPAPRGRIALVVGLATCALVSTLSGPRAQAQISVVSPVVTAQQDNSAPAAGVASQATTFQQADAATPFDAVSRAVNIWVEASHAATQAVSRAVNTWVEESHVANQAVSRSVAAWITPVAGTLDAVSRGLSLNAVAPEVFASYADRGNASRQLSVFSSTPAAPLDAVARSVSINAVAQEIFESYGDFGYASQQASVFAGIPAGTGSLGATSQLVSLLAQVPLGTLDAVSRELSSFNAIYLTPTDSAIDLIMGVPNETDLFVLTAQSYDLALTPVPGVFRVAITNLEVPAGVTVAASLYQNEDLVNVSSVVNVTTAGVHNLYFDWNVTGTHRTQLVLQRFDNVSSSSSQAQTRLNSLVPEVSYTIKISAAPKANNGIVSQIGSRNIRMGWFQASAGSSASSALPPLSSRPSTSSEPGFLGYRVVAVNTWLQGYGGVTSDTLSGTAPLAPDGSCCCPNVPPFNGAGKCQSFDVNLVTVPEFPDYLPWPYMIQVYELYADHPPVLNAQEPVYARFDEAFTESIVLGLLQTQDAGPFCAECATVGDWSLYDAQ